MKLESLADLSCLSAIDPNRDTFISKELGECLGIEWEDEDAEEEKT